jgi:hypothetical protein
MQPDEFFHTLCRTFAELGAHQPQAVRRTLLLHERRFVGHCYRCGELTAIWSPGGDEILFLGPGQERLRTVPWPPLVQQAAA